MFEQQVTDSWKVPKSDITHCLEICWFIFRFEICHEIGFICHKLVLSCSNDSGSILSFTDIGLGYLQQFLFLQRWDFRTYHHVWNICQGHKWFLHSLIPENFNKSSSCENDDIPSTLFGIFFPLSLILFLILYKVFLLEILFWFIIHRVFGPSSSVSSIALSSLIFRIIPFRSCLLRHSIRNNFERVLNLLHHNSFPLPINYQRLWAILENSQRIQTSKMGLLIFLGNNPWFDTIEYHVINCNPISQMDRFLNT